MQQNCFMVVLSSITYANKSKMLLRDSGIESKILHATSGINGCGYLLRVKDTSPSKVIQILSKAGVPIQNIKPCDTT